jgi:MoxR-like ATPase
VAETAAEPLPDLDLAFADVESVRRACEGLRHAFARLRAMVGRVIVGQDEVVVQTLIALFCDGHVLLEGVPGLGKTLLVRTLSGALSLPFSRIQFTPDLMPADITGTSVVVEDQASRRRSFAFRPGPIFSQILLADEINRATPKSQSALLEAMQERSVTVAGETRRLARPFLVLATQNPIEQEGTYPLPEAQLDRFFFKIVVPFVKRDEMNQVLARTTGEAAARVRPVMDGPYIVKAQQLARRTVVAPHVQDFIVRLVLATHPGSGWGAAEVDRYIRVGVSPRGAQALIAAAKVRALLAGRYAVSFRDVDEVARPALRHRILRSFEAEADGVTTDDIVGRLLRGVPRAPGGGAPAGGAGPG